MVDLGGLPVISNTKLSVVASITAHEMLPQPQRLDAVVAGAAQFHIASFALDRASGSVMSTTGTTAPCGRAGV